jgi:hypothetical protein
VVRPSFRVGGSDPEGGTNHRRVETPKGEVAMPMVIAYHEIDDRDHWLASPKREEFFEPLGISVRTFLDPENPNRAAVLADVPDMAAFQTAMRSQEAADAMAHDGVRADTLIVLVEA